MIKFSNVSKSYSLKRNNSVVALKNISGYFSDKGLYFIIGKSGCGKTTLLNILGGIDKIDSGDMLIEGTSIKFFSESKLDQYRNNYVGMIFQDHNLLDEYNVSGNISLALNLQNSKSDDLKIINVLSYVGMDGYEKRKINELSGGQKTKSCNC
jgi:ABC-type lipoprotein export system ATPase subunit